MPYEFLEDASIADIAFRAWGPDVESVFVAASEATLAVMIEDPESVHPAVHRTLRLERAALDMLLFAFLNEIVYVKDAEGLLLRAESARIETSLATYTLVAAASGEKLDTSRHPTRMDIKAVTLHGFALQETPQGWEARVTVDV